MLSMPPAIALLIEPALIKSFASMAAFKPEPHTLLMVVAPVPRARPAFNIAWRAGAWPRPAGNTQPIITSSIASFAKPVCASALAMAVAPSSVDCASVNAPINPPIGVRFAATITTDSKVIINSVVFICK